MRKMINALLLILSGANKNCVTPTPTTNPPQDLQLIKVNTVTVTM